MRRRKTFVHFLVSGLVLLLSLPEWTSDKSIKASGEKKGQDEETTFRAQVKLIEAAEAKLHRKNSSIKQARPGPRG